MEVVQKDHDAVCVDIVNQIADLGGFKVDLPVYVTCYADKGECFYFVSSEKKHVYEFMEQKLKEELYCIPPIRKSTSKIVPAGQKDTLYQQLKVEAAKNVMQEGVGDIARTLQKLAPKSTNEAQEVMELLRLDLKGIFREEKRQLYKGLLETAYYAKKVSGAYYNKTLEWLKLEEQQLEEERIKHAVHERVYSGFAYYKSNQTIGYYSNAVYEATITKREEFLIEGKLVSPILTKRYCFADISQITKILDDFKNILKKYINEDFMELLKFVYQTNNGTDHMIEKEISQADAEGNEIKKRSLRYYKTLWQT